MVTMTPAPPINPLDTLKVRPGSRASRGMEAGVHVKEVLAINATTDELYRFWRNFENLPRFMKYVEAVRPIEGNRSHWVAKGLIGTSVEWDAEITEDVPGQRIAWRSLAGSSLTTEGVVRFRTAPGGRGSCIEVDIRYDPPGGAAAGTMAKLFGRSADQEIRADLRRFKQFLETGEIPTTKGQSSGRGRESWEQTGGMVLLDREASGLGWLSLALGGMALAAPETVARLAGTRGHHGLIRLVGLREVASGLGILNSRRPAGWLWGRVAGDLMDLTLLGTALSAPDTQKRRTLATTAAILGVAGVDLLAALQQSTAPDAIWFRSHDNQGRTDVERARSVGLHR